MKLNLLGSMPVILPRDPQSAMEAATIDYVNSKIADLEARMDALHLYVTNRM